MNAVLSPAPPRSATTRFPLDAERHVLLGRLPDAALPSASGFETLWNLHPDGFRTIQLHSRLVQLPRWQQAYGRDYRFSGQISQALPIPPDFLPFLTWGREAIEPHLDSMLVNWYDGTLGHYIGRHRDSAIGMRQGAPIVTVSLGETRIFRMRKWRGDGQHDFAVDHGSVIVMPYDTNRAWTHEIVKSKRATGRRISITMRAFD